MTKDEGVRQRSAQGQGNSQGADGNIQMDDERNETNLPGNDEEDNLLPRVVEEEEADPTPEQKLDQIYAEIGGIGCYHVFIFLSINAAMTAVFFIQFSMGFLT